MKPVDIFRLAVRGLGLLFLYQMVQALVTALSMLSVWSGMGHVVVRPAWGKVILLGLAAVWCLFGAPPIQRWAYPAKDEKGKLPGPGGEPPVNREQGDGS